MSGNRVSSTCAEFRTDVNPTGNRVSSTIRRAPCPDGGTLFITKTLPREQEVVTNDVFKDI